MTETGGTRPDRRVLALWFLVLAVAVAWVLRAPHKTTLNWDEVSYVRAAGMGYWANAWDEGSLPAADLVRFIAAKWRHRPPQMPDGYDEDRDPLLLRNLHPPFIVYLVVPVARSLSEPVLRLGQLLGAWLLLAILLLAHRWTSPHTTRSGLVAVGVLGVWAGGLTFAYIQCHGWTTIWTLGSVAALGRWLSRRDRAWGFVTAACLALSIATLHTGLVVVAGVAATIVVLGLLDRRLRAPWRDVAAAGVVVLTAVLLTWPGSAAKLSLLRIVAQYAYLMRMGKEWSDSLLLDNVLALLPLLVPLPVLCFWVATRHRAELARWAPALVVGVLYAIPVVPHMVTPTYALPALIALVPLVGWLVDSLGLRSRLAAAGSVCALVFVALWVSRPQGDDSAQRADFAWLASTLQHREVLADGAHVLQHYLGAGYRIRPVSVDYEEDALLVREHGEWRRLSARDTSGRLVVIQTRRERLAKGETRPPEIAECPLTARATVLLFDCTSRTD